MTLEPTCKSVASDDVIRRYVTDGLAPEEIEAFEAHLLTCGTCQTELRLALAIQDELGRQRRAPSRIAAGSHRSTRRWLGAAGTAVAAAAALWFVVVYPGGPGEQPGSTEHRAPMEAGEEAALPVPIAPVGITEAVTEVLWGRVTGADRYRVTLFDDAGDILWELEARDTTVLLPESVELTAGVSYFWKVDARVGFERWLKSDVVEFRLASEAGLSDSAGQLPR